MPYRRWDPWSVPTLVLWMAFFAAGFQPEGTFDLLRRAGRVVTQDAMVNSPYLVTLGFSGYLAYFAYQRCREVGQSPIDAQGRALQVLIVGLLAFLNVPLQTLRDLQQVAIGHQRHLIYAIFACKSLACLYLMSLVTQYYLLGREQAFASLVSVFPSTYIGPHTAEPLGEPRPVAWTDPGASSSGDAPTAPPRNRGGDETNKEPAGS